MRKKIGFLILMILGVIFTVGFFRYNPTVNTTDKIPVSADVVIRINLREIEYNMLKDVVQHPFSYVKYIKNMRFKKRFLLLEELEIPANIFFYTNQDNLKHTWISTAFQIKNKSNILSFFKKEGFLKKSLPNLDYFKRENIIFCMCKNELKVLFDFSGNFKSSKNLKIEEKLKRVFNTKTYLKKENKQLFKLQKSKSLIAISTKTDDFLELKIHGNTLSVLGELTAENTPFLSYENQYESQNNQNNSHYLASVSGKFKKKFLFKYLKKAPKDKFKKLTNVSVDSILKHWNGIVDARLISFIQRKDTIVSYQYDADFNKIEKISIQKTVIPSFNFKFGGNSLFEYLSSKKAIKNIEGENLLVVNPFFKTYASNNKSNNSNSKKELFLFSKEAINANFNNNTPNVNNKFSLFFDVEKYLKTQEGSLVISKDYLVAIKKIQAVVTKKNKVAIKVFFKKTPQNFMYQLLK